MEDFNKAYNLAQSNKPGSDFNEANLAYISRALNQDRIRLLQKLANFQEIAIDFKVEIEKIQSLQINNPIAQIQASQHYAHFKSEQLEITKKVIELIDPSSGETNTAEKIEDAIKVMAKKTKPDDCRNCKFKS